MSAEAIWHTLMGAVPGGGRDKMPGHFAAGCTRTLMPPGTTSGCGLTGRVNEFAAMPGLAA